MTKIIHITDPHIAPSGRRVVGFDPVLRLERTIEAVNRDHFDARACVITGDLTDHGEVESYRIFQELVAGFSMPVHLALGNHDNREVFRDHFPSAPKDPGGFVQYCFKVDGIRCVILDTTDSLHAAAGRLCKFRLDWLAHTLSQSVAPTVIFMHHPPANVDLPWFQGMLLDEEDSRELRGILSSSQCVIHIAFGHIHVPFRGVLDGISLSCSRGTCHKILDASRADQATYEDAAPAFDILTVTHEGVEVLSVDPEGTGVIVAREFATPDGVGRLEILAEART